MFLKPNLEIQYLYRIRVIYNPFKLHFVVVAKSKELAIEKVESECLRQSIREERYKIEKVEQFRLDTVLFLSKLE